jgi:hypothetical protein
VGKEKICYIRPAATLKLELDKKVKTILTNYERDLIEAFETSYDYEDVEIAGCDFPLEVMHQEANSSRWAAAAVQNHFLFRVMICHI